MMLDCVIIDDEPLALSLMESYVNRTPFLNLVGKYSSAVLAMAGIAGKKIDVMFLDIQMPDLDGLEFSKTVDKHTKIIFTTAFGQYAIDGYKVNALDYLLKPVSYVDFLKAANRAVEWFEACGNTEKESKNTIYENRDFIFVKSDYKLVRIDLDSVLYIEGLKDYVKIFMEDISKPVISLMSMKSMEDMLPYEMFMRVHRSFIVNKNKIKVIDHGRIVFGKEYIPIGDSYKQAFMSFVDNSLSL